MERLPVTHKEEFQYQFTRPEQVLFNNTELWHYYFMTQPVFFNHLNSFSHGKHSVHTRRYPDRCLATRLFCVSRKQRAYPHFTGNRSRAFPDQTAGRPHQCIRAAAFIFPKNNCLANKALLKRMLYALQHPFLMDFFKSP
jgi:hypothetical protein